MDDNEPLTMLNLGTRAYNALTSAGYQTVGDVRKAPDAELRRLPQIGSTTVREIRKVCPFGRGQIGLTQKTLRDEFAGLAMQGILAGVNSRLPGGADEAIVAQDAYAIADAMLAARGQ
jgi:hypothetical protein